MTQLSTSPLVSMGGDQRLNVLHSFSSMKVNHKRINNIPLQTEVSIPIGFSYILRQESLK